MSEVPPPRRAFLPRYITLLAGEAISKLCVFVAFMYLARVLGPRGFGQIEFALSLTVFFSLGVESGFGAYAARRVSLDAADVGSLLARVIAVRTALAVPGYLALLLIARLVPPDLGAVVRMYGLLVFAAPLFSTWIFQGFQQMQWVALGTVLRAVTFLALVLFLVREYTDPRVVGAAELTAAAAMVVLHAVIRWKWGLRPEWRGVRAGSRQLFKEAWPLGASDLTWAALWYAPTVVLGTIAGAAHVAWQAASVRIVFSLHTGVWLYFFNALPNLTTALAEGLDTWRRLLNRSLASSMWAGSFVALLGTLLASEIITAVYGDTYEPARVPFQISIWMIPITWVSGHFRYSLIAGGQQSWEFLASALTAAFTIVVTALLASVAQSVGAALGLLLGGIFNLVVAAVFVGRTIGRPVGVVAPVARVGASCAACVVLGFQLAPRLGAPVAAIAACGILGVLALWDQRSSLGTRWNWNL